MTAQATQAERKCWKQGVVSASVPRLEPDGLFLKVFAAVMVDRATAQGDDNVLNFLEHPSLHPQVLEPCGGDCECRALEMSFPNSCPHFFMPWIEEELRIARAHPLYGRVRQWIIEDRRGEGRRLGFLSSEKL